MLGALTPAVSETATEPDAETVADDGDDEPDEDELAENEFRVAQLMIDKARERVAEGKSYITKNMLMRAAAGSENKDYRDDALVLALDMEWLQLNGDGNTYSLGPVTPPTWADLLGGTHVDGPRQRGGQYPQPKADPSS